MTPLYSIKTIFFISWEQNSGLRPDFILKMRTAGIIFFGLNLKEFAYLYLLEKSSFRQKNVYLRIDGIAWDLNPTKTFENKKGEQMSFEAYYKVPVWLWVSIWWILIWSGLYTVSVLRILPVLWSDSNWKSCRIFCY